MLPFIFCELGFLPTTLPQFTVFLSPRPSILILSIEGVRLQYFPIFQQSFLQYFPKIIRYYSIVFLVTHFSLGKGFGRIISIGPNMCTTIRETGVAQYSARSDLLCVLVRNCLYLHIPKIPLECYSVQCRYSMHWHMYANLVCRDST